MPESKKSIHLTAGLVLGSIVAAATTFLYKTKKGKKIRKEFAKHLDDTKTYLPELIKNIKIKAKKLEVSLENTGQELEGKSKKAKKKIIKTASKVKKNLFVKSGKPLVK